MQSSWADRDPAEQTTGCPGLGVGDVNSPLMIGNAAASYNYALQECCLTCITNIAEVMQIFLSTPEQNISENFKNDTNPVSLNLSFQTNLIKL